MADENGMIPIQIEVASAMTNLDKLATALGNLGSLSNRIAPLNSALQALGPTLRNLTFDARAFTTAMGTTSLGDAIKASEKLSVAMGTSERQALRDARAKRDNASSVLALAQAEDKLARAKQMSSRLSNKADGTGGGNRLAIGPDMYGQQRETFYRKRIAAESRYGQDLLRVTKQNNIAIANEMEAHRNKVAQGPDLDGTQRASYLRSQSEPAFAAARGVLSTHDTILRDVNKAGGWRRWGQDAGFATTEITSMRKALESTGHIADAVLTPMDRAFQKMQSHLLQAPMMIAYYGSVYAVLQGIVSTLSMAVSEGSEFQKQAIFFTEGKRAARTLGEHPDDSNPSQLLNASIALASKYGDEVNDVAQDLNLWYKATGNLNASMFMTNEALKFQLATGTQIEDFYKTLTALSNQAADMPLNRGDKKGFDLHDTPQLMQKITALSFAMGAGFDQVDKKGKEMGSHLNNGAVLLMESLDKDAGALKTLGYSVTQAAEMNAALIRSFGNTGSAASDAGEKIGRIAGGLAALSKPGEIKKFGKAGFDLGALTSAMNTHKDILLELSKEYEHLSVPQRNVFSTTIAGTRQYEALAAVLEGYAKNLDKVTKASSDLGVENRLASEMAGTFDNSVHRLTAAWEGFLITMSIGVLPALTTFVNFVTNDVLPVIAAMGQGLHDVGADAIDAGRKAVATNSLNNNNARILELQKMLTQPQQSKAERAALEARYNSVGMKLPPAPSMNRQQILNELHSRQQQQRGLSGELNAYDHNWKVRNPFSVYSGDWEKYDASRIDRDTWTDASGKNRSEYARSHKGSDKGFVAAHPNKFYYKHSQYERNGSAIGGQAMGAMVRGMGNGDFSAMLAANVDKFRFPKGDNPYPQGNLLGPGTGTGAHPLSPDAQQRNAVEEQKAMYSDLKSDADAEITSTDDIVTHKKRLITIYGSSTKAVHDYAAAVHASMAAIRGKIKVDQDEEAAMKTVEATAYGHLHGKGAYAKSDKRYGEQLGIYRDAKHTRQADEGDEGRNSVRLDSLADDISGAYNTEYRGQLSRADTKSSAYLKMDTRAYSDTENFGAKDQASAKLYQDINKAFKERLELVKQLTGPERQEAFDALEMWRVDELETWNNQLRENTKSMREFNKTSADGISGNQAKYLDTLLKIAGTAPGADKNKLAGMSTLVSAHRSLVDNQSKYDEMMVKAKGTSAEGGVNEWKATADAVTEAEFALGKYENRLKEIQDSSVYKGIEAAFKSITDTLSKDIMSSMFNEQQVQRVKDQYQSTINYIGLQKTAEMDLYDSRIYHSARDTAIHDIAIRHIDDQIKKEQELAKLAADKAGQKGLLKTAAEAFTKSLIDSFAQKFNSGALKFLFKTDPNKELQGVIKDQTTSIEQHLYPTIHDELVPILTTLNDTLQNGGLGSSSAMARAFAAAGGSTTSLPGLGGGWFGFGTSGSGPFSKSSGGSGGGLMSLLGLGLNSVGSGGPIASGAALAMALKSGGANAGIGAILGGAAATSIVGSMIGVASGGAAGGMGAGLSALLGGGPAGIAVLLGAMALGGAAGGVFGPHLNAQTSPDIFRTQEFGQASADLGGAGLNGLPSLTANGTAFNESATMAKALGGTGEVSFIANYIKQHPDDAAKVLTPDQLKEFTGATSFNYKGKGNYDLGNGQVVNWESLSTAANDAVTSIQQLSNAAAGATQPLVAINQYGGGGTPYGWNTPGYGYPTPIDPSQVNQLVNTIGSTGVISPPPQGGIATRPVEHTPLTVNLDGRIIARSTQGYQARSSAAGYRYVT